MKREIGCTSCVLSIGEIDLAGRRRRRRDHLAGSMMEKVLLIASVMPVAVKRSW